MNVACIGIGGKGTTDSMAMQSENVVALCDVDEGPGKFKKIYETYPNARRFKDYREMLEEMDGQIDAVTVSTPDHTHFPAAMEAIRRGKHAFVQKPLTRTIWEARVLADAARLHGVATQMGNQGHAAEGPRLLCEWIAAGAIGDVHEVHIWTDRPTSWGIPCGMDRPTEEEAVPEGLDWNLWLGTAPFRPYHSLYCPKRWRSWWDFGSGALGDMGCHIMDAPFWALNLGSPVSAEAQSSSVNDETFPKWAIITYEFAARDGMPPVKLVWYDGKKLPARPKELEADRELNKQGGQIYYGDKGVILCDSHSRSPRLIPETAMKEFLPKRPPASIPRSIGHYEEWIAACKGDKPAMSNFDYAGPLTEAVLFGNLALKAGKKVYFDAEKIQVTNAPELDDYIRPAYRPF
ncbi:MAG: 1,5-anhydro-D-fructose reductase [candidate division BRC1 bacterium ADurb.BinA364]|nr:MAG: 1,5-anhydro-D-fructose reductase [candidate division BRC1 bacterium ADurb.BinA364]